MCKSNVCHSVKILKIIHVQSEKIDVTLFGSFMIEYFFLSEVNDIMLIAMHVSK